MNNSIELGKELGEIGPDFFFGDPIANNFKLRLRELSALPVQEFPTQPLHHEDLAGLGIGEILWLGGNRDLDRLDGSMPSNLDFDRFE